MNEVPHPSGSSLLYNNNNPQPQQDQQHGQQPQQNGQNQNQNQQQNYPIVEVIAPATLNQGYTFDVEVNHEILTVTVPPGGVREGDTFQSNTQPKIQESSTVFRIPIGIWKDNLCDICKYGPCHSSILLSLLCPLVSLGQIYTRLELAWNGVPAPSYSPLEQQQQQRGKFTSFNIMVGMTFVYMICKQIIGSSVENPDPNSYFTYHALYVLNLIYFIVIMILVGKTRRYVRERYDIPSTYSQWKNGTTAGGSNGRNIIVSDDDNDEFGDDGGFMKVCCGELEDYVLGGCCYPCVLSQMNRHTAMYDTYEGNCFSPDGLPPHAPTMV
jgi:hypothetical protein